MIYQTKSTVMHVRPSLVGLWTYGQHWALEVLEAVTIDGEPVNDKYGYQKSYLFTLFGGKPLFMFERDGQIGINLGGEEILLPGDRVPHYNCCGSTMINPRFSEYVLDFFLADGDQWYYVEVERLDSNISPKIERLEPTNLTDAKQPINPPP